MQAVDCGTHSAPSTFDADIEPFIKQNPPRTRPTEPDIQPGNKREIQKTFDADIKAKGLCAPSKLTAATPESDKGEEKAVRARTTRRIDKKQQKASGAGHQNPRCCFAFTTP